MRKLLLILVTGFLFPVVRAGLPDKLPRLDMLSVSVDAKLAPAESRLDATAEVRVRLADRTNFIGLRLNGNLEATEVTDEQGEALRFVQESGEPAGLVVHLGSQREASTELVVRVAYHGVFAVSEFDFNRAVGSDAYSLVSPDLVELYASAFWYPRSSDILDRCRYAFRVTLPPGLTVYTAGELAEKTEEGGAAVFLYRTDGETLSPSLVAGRFRVVEKETGGGERIRFALRKDIPDEGAALDKFVACASFVEERFPRIPWPAGLTVVEVSNECRETFGMPGIVFLRSREFAAAATHLREGYRRFAQQKWLFQLRYVSLADAWVPEGFSRLAAAFGMAGKDGEEALAREMRACAVDALKFADAETVRRGVRLGPGSEKYHSVVVSKGAWVLYMLRGILGAAEFERLMKTVAEHGLKEPLDSGVLQRLASEIHGKDLAWFFPQWLDNVNLPRFSVDYLVFRKSAGGYTAEGKVDQEGTLFRMPLDLRVNLKDGFEHRTLEMAGDMTRFRFDIQARPVKLDLDPEYRMLHRSRDLEVEVFIVRGEEAFENGDYLGAVDHFRRAVELENRNSLAYFRMALVFFAQGNYNTAVDTFRDALNGSGKPEWVLALCYLNIGKCYDLLGQRERAIAEYNKAINTADDSRGAVTEAGKFIKEPFATGKPGESAPPPEPPAGSEAKGKTDTRAQ
ncbi:MAG: tetratricopeptide repeat protein [Acidobacteria bacterium]|nr:tetratricopeptide repeat protein [Acidobacteriota bacterium]